MAKKTQAPTTMAVADPTNGHVPAANPLSTSATATNAVAAVPPLKSDAAESAESRDPTGTAIQQALALRDSLRDVLSQTNHLVAALKREKRQARLVATTLASLKQLQAVS